jgi:hypothetical protein
MVTFTDYATKYQHVRMERRNGILQLTLHSNGDTLRWGGGPHEELGFAFHDIGSDPENRVIILTGTGDAFIEEVDAGNLGQRLPASSITPRVWDHIYWDAKRLLMNLLDIEVPMIAAVNGPVLIHAELAVLCDIVLAAETEQSMKRGHERTAVAPLDFHRLRVHGDIEHAIPHSKQHQREYEQTCGRTDHGQRKGQAKPQRGDCGHAAAAETGRVPI